MSYIIIIFAVILDQITKYLAVAKLKTIDTFPLIDGIFHFTYAENTGAAFSIFTGMQPFLKIVTSAFTAALAVYLYLLLKKQQRTSLTTISLAFIIGGAIGNLIDRFRFDYVIDFLDFRLINFAVFNIADSFIVVGSILLILILIFEPSGNTSP
ncbi:MAG: signal peptidase II [Eubacteriaceae bacterium]|nr:signal peptidase II [Eubacteriaceae bacterium]